MSAKPGMSVNVELPSRPGQPLRITVDLSGSATELSGYLAKLSGYLAKLASWVLQYREGFLPPPVPPQGE